MKNLKLNTLLIFSTAVMFLSGCYTQFETVKDDYEKSGQTATVSSNFTDLQVQHYNYGLISSSRYGFGYGLGYGYGNRYGYGLVSNYGCVFGIDYGYGCAYGMGYGSGYYYRGNYYYDYPDYFTGYSTRPDDIENLRSSGLYASGERGNRRARPNVSSNIQSVRTSSITNSENNRINQSGHSIRGERVANSGLKRGERNSLNVVNMRQDSYNTNSAGDHGIRNGGMSITNSPASDGLKSRKDQRVNRDPKSSISRREIRSVYADTRAKNAQRSIIQTKYSSVDTEKDDFYYVYRFSQALRNGGSQNTLLFGAYSNNSSEYSWVNRKNGGSNSREMYNNWKRSQNSRVSNSRGTSSVGSSRTTTVRKSSTSSNRSQRSGSTGTRKKSGSDGGGGSNPRSTGSNN